MTCMRDSTKTIEWFRIVPMEIGLISDTHGYLDPRVFKAFESCDEIWHAGDFGSLEIAEQLAEFKPFRAVYGNIDDGPIRHAYPLDLRFELENVDVWMTHIVGHPGRYHPRVRKILNANPPQLLVCGHSHLLRVEQDGRYNKMQYVNPGAAGNYGQQLVRTLMKMDLDDGLIHNMRIIELGPRGKNRP